MRLNRAAAAAIAAVAIVSGCGVTHHGAISATHIHEDHHDCHHAPYYHALARQNTQLRPSTRHWPGWNQPAARLR